jgi:regulatory protein
MALIEKITWAETHVKITFDGADDITLSPETALQYRLSSGLHCDPVMYAQIMEEGERFSCWRRSLEYLARRSRSAHEIELYLKKKKFSPHIIAGVLARLHDYKYIDDEAYARWFIRCRLQRGAAGPFLLKKELMMRGVSRDCIARALKSSESLIPTDDTLYDSAVKKFRILGNKSDPLTRVARFLYSRGFDSTAVNRVIRQLKSEYGTGNDSDYPDEVD